jgi:uncharacterized damage-inducible protein DinB
MYRKLDDFLGAWKSHSDATRKIFAALTDESIARTVAEGHRSLAGMAWHIVTTIPEMMKQTGLSLSAIDSESAPPATAAEICAGYDTTALELTAALGAGWDDAALEVVDELYGEKWARGLTLAILLNHEIHHRGQMTVLMRQAGLEVPGIYGPAAEEWDKMGMPRPPY